MVASQLLQHVLLVNITSHQQVPHLFCFGTSTADYDDNIIISQLVLDVSPGDYTLFKCCVPAC